LDIAPEYSMSLIVVIELITFWTTSNFGVLVFGFIECESSNKQSPTTTQLLLESRLAFRLIYYQRYVF